jgi:hypothetical protein
LNLVGNQLNYSITGNNPSLNELGFEISNDGTEINVNKIIKFNNLTVGNDAIFNGTTVVAVPIGTIIMWSKETPPPPNTGIWKESGFIPGENDYWAPCTGENETPDLRGRFPIGSGTSGNHNFELKTGTPKDFNKIGGYIPLVEHQHEDPEAQGEHKHDLKIPVDWQPGLENLFTTHLHDTWHNDEKYIIRDDSFKLDTNGYHTHFPKKVARNYVPHEQDLSDNQHNISDINMAIIKDADHSYKYADNETDIYPPATVIQFWMRIK